MSEISQKVANFQKRQNDEHEAIRKAVMDGLQKQENDLLSELSESSARIESAIKERNRRLNSTLVKAFLSAGPWLGMALVVMLLIVGGLVWYSNHKIGQIGEMNATISRLEQLGGKINMTRCGDGQNAPVCVRVDKSKGVFGNDGDYMVIK